MSINSTPQKTPDFLRKTFTSPHSTLEKNDPYAPLLAIYLLRLARGLRNNITTKALAGLFTGNLGSLTGLSATDAPSIKTSELWFEVDDPEDTDLDKKYKLIGLIFHRLKQLIKQGMDVDTPLFNNVKMLADKFNLSPVDQEIAVLCLLMSRNLEFNEFVVEQSGWCDETSLLDSLCILTTRPMEDIKNSLKPDGFLCQLGWVMHSDGYTKMDTTLNFPPAMLDALFKEHESVENLFKCFFQEIKAPTLQLGDYPQLQNDLEVIIPYLHAALQSKRAGVNLLIHGKAGASKRELAALLATQANASLFEVCSKKSLPVEEDRFAASKLAQYVLSHQSGPALIMIDEADEILPNTSHPNFMDFDDDYAVNPAWIDRQLNTNPLPVIWIINRTKTIEPDFLARFDYALEVDKMPLSLRRRHLTEATRDLAISPTWLEQLAVQTEITLGQIEKAVTIAKLSQQTSTLSAEHILERTLNASMRLLTPLLTLKKTVHATGYDLRFTNANIQPVDLLNGLKRRQRGNFCFYGAPGTGKTAFATHLSEQLGLPILIKKASDIFDKYTGESEKNIARMFYQAERQGAVLLLDEADSFLSDRRDARYQWEIAQVNEMLTQMEKFQGIFICTTNLMEKLDAASLRRFDFKVKFDYLTAEQRWALFEQESQRLGAKLPKPSEALHRLKQKIQRLTKLTPGDFAVLNRQTILMGKPPELENMVAVLEQECLAKGENFAQIGFVH